MLGCFISLNVYIQLLMTFIKLFLQVWTLEETRQNPVNFIKYSFDSSWLGTFEQKHWFTLTVSLKGNPYLNYHNFFNFSFRF